jgi:hypothetical protein
MSTAKPNSCDYIIVELHFVRESSIVSWILLLNREKLVICEVLGIVIRVT